MESWVPSSVSRFPGESALSDDETDDERVFHVCGCSTKDLPVAVEIVAYAQYEIPLPYNLASRNRNYIRRVRERPTVGRKQMLVLVYPIAHEFLQSA